MGVAYSSSIILASDIVYATYVSDIVWKSSHDPAAAEKHVHETLPKDLRDIRIRYIYLYVRVSGSYSASPFSLCMHC